MAEEMTEDVAGPSGFQYPMRRNSLAGGSILRAGGVQLDTGEDALPAERADDLDDTAVEGVDGEAGAAGD